VIAYTGDLGDNIEQVVEELAKLDACNSDLLDFSADSDATNDTAEFTVTVQASSIEGAMSTGVSCIRAAIHATGASTHGWDDEPDEDTVVIYQVDSDEGVEVRPLVDACPWGAVAVDTETGAVYVADSGNNRMLEFQNFVSGPTNGAPATYVFGQQDFVHNTRNDPDQDGKTGDQRDNPAGSGVTAGTMSSPQGLYVSAPLNLILLADTGNSRILRFPILGPSSTGPNGNYGVDGTDTDDGNFCF